MHTPKSIFHNMLERGIVLSKKDYKVYIIRENGHALFIVFNEGNKLLSQNVDFDDIFECVMEWGDMLNYIDSTGLFEEIKKIVSKSTKVLREKIMYEYNNVNPMFDPNV